MTHDPRIFIAPGQEPGGTGHQLHIISGASPALPGILAHSELKEFTVAEYAAYDAATTQNKNFKYIEANGGR